MLAMMASNNLCEPLKALETKYLIAHGLMLNIKNELILRNLVSEINVGFDALMIECIVLCGDDLLPGTQTKKADVMTAKIEFDARVMMTFYLAHRLKRLML